VISIKERVNVLLRHREPIWYIQRSKWKLHRHRLILGFDFLTDVVPATINIVFIRQLYSVPRGQKDLTSPSRRRGSDVGSFKNQHSPPISKDIDL
jgi:hypothetical protein